MESKKHTRSVIARLMGLDELPPQKPVCKPHRVLSENYLQKSASIGLIEKRSYHKSHSFRVTNEKGQEFINVFEVPEIPTMDKHCIQSIQEGKANASMTEVKMSIISQKFTHANRLSMDEKHQHSQEFDGVLEELDSNEDLLPIYIQQPDSLFTKHFHDLQFDQPHSQSGHVRVLKSSNGPYSRKNEISRKSERTTVQRNILRSLQKLENGVFIDSCGDLDIDYTCQLSNSRLELKDETCFSPTRMVKDGIRHSPSRIVVLKPNLGKAQNAAWSSFSPISEEGSQSSDRPMPGLNQCQTMYSPWNRSSYAKQVKKQLSERWKMFKCRQEVGVASSGTSIGEMLSLPNQETRPRKLNYKLDKSGMNNQLSLNDGDADLGSHFGISSRDGWKECASSLTRSGSLPAACITVEIPKSRTRKKAVCNDFCLKLEESVPEGKNGSRKQNCSPQDSSQSRISRFSNEKAQTSSCMNSGNNHIMQDVCVIQDELENKIEKEDFSEESFVNSKLSQSSVLGLDLEYDQTVPGTQLIQDELKSSCGENNLSGNREENSIFPNSSINSVASSSINSEVEVVAETEIVGMCEEQHSEPVACILDASVGQECCSPSPNSVLEPPFSEEILSGSECFQGVGADLHGLWMQLQLLKSESEESNSGPGMVVSSDEGSGDGSTDLSKENEKLAGLFRAEESRDFSYVVDVLDEAGIHGCNMQLGFETWHSKKSPVNPSVFEMLEKKYGKQACWEKSERKLLFDRVNLGLKEILQPCMNVLKWAKPLRRRLNHSQSREVIEEELWMFLGSQEKEVSKDLSEKAMGTETRWSELWDDIDLIVSEIEKFLFDELAAELVSIESF